MTNLPEEEPADASPPEALSDQELDERLKDPDFIRQLDEFRPPKAARQAQKWRGVLVWVTKSTLMTLAVSDMMLPPCR